jgi:hypothetical protein
MSDRPERIDEVAEKSPKQQLNNTTMSAVITS